MPHPSRRSLIAGLLASPIVGSSSINSYADEDNFFGVPTEDLSTPGELDPLKLYGTGNPSDDERERAAAIIQGAPSGPAPIDVARYFLSDKVDPHYREQWPKSAAWNPVIVEFFKAAGFTASNDMVAWCAAFVNWCLVQSLRRGSGSPSSQSFLDETKFKRTNNPKIGDVVVFTCRRVEDDKPIGLGHVAFVSSIPTGDRMTVVGGNQHKGGHSSIISEVTFPFVSNKFGRCVSAQADGTCTQRVDVVLKQSAFISIV
jgi:uncharacterized protein (TIGR02594 family)